MVTKKTVWIASDGSQHDYKSHAEFWDEIVALFEYIDDHPIYGNSDGCRVDGGEVKTWLDENPRIHMTLLPEESVATPRCPECESIIWRNRNGHEVNKRALDRICDNCNIEYTILESQLPR